MNKYILGLLLVGTLWCNQNLRAQNLQNFTPSVLLNKGQSEFKIFNNLYTQTKVRDASGNSIDLPVRQSFLTNQFRFTHGVTESRRLNLGLEANFASGAVGDDDTGIFNILGGDRIINNSLFSSIGPTVRFTPLSNVGNFSVQSTFLFPLNSDRLESPVFVAFDRYTWYTQFFYDYSFNSKLNLFLEIDYWSRISTEEGQNTLHDIPLTAFLSYFVNGKFTVYSNAQYSPRFGDFAGDFGRIQWFTQVGAGAKYLVLPFLELEVSYTNFILSRDSNNSAPAGSTFNFGIRILR